jgi:hypothetical protein
LADFTAVLEVLEAELTGSHWKATLKWGAKMAAELKEMGVSGPSGGV